MSLYSECVEKGVQIDHHESDLYIPVNDITMSLIRKYDKKNPQIFVSNIDGKPWYDIPFSYDPYWEKLT